MTIDEIIRSGDRVEFKRFLEHCGLEEARMAWLKATKARVQDFSGLAFEKMNRLALETPIRHPISSR
jgi:hypothetical protein